MLKVRAIRGLRGEEGLSMVETAISCTVLFALLFGICQMSLAIYVYYVTSDAARQATRYAIVRGSTSCTNTPNLSNCDATAANIQSYVQGLGFPGIKSSQVGVSTSWYSSSSSTPTTWSACGTGICNAPGNLVKITVSYPMTFQIPFSKNIALNLTSTSQMVISQ